MIARFLAWFGGISEERVLDALDDMIDTLDGVPLALVMVSLIGGLMGVVFIMGMLR